MIHGYGHIWLGEWAKLLPLRNTDKAKSEEAEIIRIMLGLTDLSFLSGVLIYSWGEKEAKEIFDRKFAYSNRKRSVGAMWAGSIIARQALITSKIDSETISMHRDTYQQMIYKLVHDNGYTGPSLLTEDERYCGMLFKNWEKDSSLETSGLLEFLRKPLSGYK